MLNDQKVLPAASFAPDGDLRYAQAKEEANRLGGQLLALKTEIANMKTLKPNKPFTARTSQLSPRDSRSVHEVPRSDSFVAREDALKAATSEEAARSEQP